MSYIDYELVGREDDWPRYDETKQLLQLQRDNITAINDGMSRSTLAPINSCSSSPQDFHVTQTNFLNSARVLNAFEK